MQLTGFDARAHEPIRSFDPLPNGDYTAAITNTAEKSTRSGDGSYLELTFQILEGDFAGRNIWERLNLKNPNINAVEIAQKRLGMICRAVGVYTPNDSSELQNIPLTISVVNKKRADTGEMRNEIKSFSAKSTAAPMPAASGDSASVPPWKR